MNMSDEYYKMIERRMLFWKILSIVELMDL